MIKSLYRMINLSIYLQMKNSINFQFITWWFEPFQKCDKKWGSQSEINEIEFHVIYLLYID